MAVTVETPHPRAGPPSVRARPVLLLADLGAILALIAVAAAIRLPGLMWVPRFTDEQLDVLYTLPLYRLQGLPLVGFDPYNGPLFSYLLAISLWVFGPQPWTPRLLSLLLALGTVAATYWLGRNLGGRVAGLMAGGLLATSAVHTFINSHMAWSNATTPFFTTLAFVLILPAITRGSGPSLAIGTFAFAIALQTHPSVMLFIPGVGLAVLLARPRLVRSRWTIVAAALFMLGYSNVIAYNVLPKGADPYWQQAKQFVPSWGRTDDNLIGRLSQEERMNAEGATGLAGYPNSLWLLTVNLPRVAANLIEPRPVLTDFLREPTFWLYGALVPLGLAWPLRRRNPLPLAAGLGFLLLVPLFNAKFEPIFNGRYVMPVLPLAFAGVGTLIADLAGWLRSRPARGALAVLALALVAYPLIPLVRYHQRNEADGQLNQDLIQTAATVAAARHPDEPILLDEALGRRNLPADGDLLMNLQTFLQFRGAAYRVGPATPAKLDGELGNARAAIVVLSQPYDRGLEARYRFTSLEERGGGRYAAYRLERR